MNFVIKKTEVEIFVSLVPATVVVSGSVKAISISVRLFPLFYIFSF